MLREVVGILRTVRTEKNELVLVFEIEFRMAIASSVRLRSLRRKLRIQLGRTIAVLIDDESRLWYRPVNASRQ